MTQHSKIRTIVTISLVLVLASCASKRNHDPLNSTTKDRLPPDSLNSAAPSVDSVQQEQPEPSGFFYCASPTSSDDDLLAKSLIGKIIPALEDSTLLTLVYGSCYKQGDDYLYNAGAQMWDESDSVYLQVQEALGDDSMKIVYIRGEMAITAVMHNHFQETALMLHQTSRGWIVMDAYLDAETIDFSAVAIAGKYDGHFLLKYETSGVYAGGVQYSSLQYRLLENNRLRGHSIEFTISSANGASTQCEPMDDTPDYHCNCYSADGKVEFTYRQDWNCLVFQYEYVREEGDCAMENATTFQAHQTWYLNADTSFLAQGETLSEWGEDIVGNVKLSNAEIKKALRVK